MKRFAISLAILFLCSSLASAVTINLFGTFTSDDNMEVFSYHVENTGPVHVFTTSYALGGFSPVLSVFDGAGNFVFDDSGYSGNRDADLSWPSVGGVSYLVVLTEYDNFPISPTFADGFTEQGNGNFTANPPFNPPSPGAFYLPSGPQLTGNWAVTFESADSTLVVTPEPASSLLLLLSAGLMWFFRKNQIQ